LTYIDKIYIDALVKEHVAQTQAAESQNQINLPKLDPNQKPEVREFPENEKKQVTSAIETTTVEEYKQLNQSLKKQLESTRLYFFITCAVFILVISIFIFLLRMKK